MVHAFQNGARRASRTGFSLVEVLAVLAVIGTLAALLFPGVTKARDLALRSRDLSAVRQVAVAYHLAAVERRGVLLPGAETGREARSETGDAVTGVPATRWPHHLRPYLGDRFRNTLYVGEQTAYYDAFSTDDYRLSLAPSFGMNTMFIGGDAARILERPVRRFEDAAVPSQLILFASSRYRILDPHAGFWRVESPFLWESGVPAATDPPRRDSAYGYVSPRWGNRVIVAHLDGSAATYEPARLRDMRLWSDLARRTNNPDHRPTPAP